MVGRFGGPLGDLVWLLGGFPSIRPQNRPLQENLKDVLETYKIPCISTRYSQRKTMVAGDDGRLRRWWMGGMA